MGQGQFDLALQHGIKEVQRLIISVVDVGDAVARGGWYGAAINDGCRL